MAFEVDRCARGRFCERAPDWSCPCDNPDSLAAELREIAEEMSEVQSGLDDLSWE